jgi:predicted PurR-regulated permease PerM
MNWLPFIIAYLIAPTLVIVVAYMFAAMLGLTVTVLIILGVIFFIGFTFFKTIQCGVQHIKQSRNPIHKTNIKYLKERLLHLP